MARTSQPTNGNKQLKLPRTVLQYDPKWEYPPAEDWLTRAEMTRQLPVSKDWVKIRLDSSSYQPELRQGLGLSKAYPHYPPECFDELKILVEERLQYPAIGQGLSILEAAEELGCTDHWILGTIKRRKLDPPKTRRRPNNRLVLSITQQTLEQLRKIQLPLPKQDWRNVRQLMTETGWAHKTILGRLKERGYKPKRLRSSLSGSPSLCFPEEVIPILGKRPRHIPPGGTWMTMERMAKLLNRTRNWVQFRITQAGLESASQLRLDDLNAIRRHFPPWVFRQLKTESDNSIRVNKRRAS